MSDVYRIRNDGQGCGGFLSPPGHPAHTHVLEGFWGNGTAKPNISARMRGRGPDMIGGIDSAPDDEHLPQHIRDQARRLLEAAELVCSPDWVANVYGYFRNSYSPDGTDRDASNAVIYKPGTSDRPPADRHLGYLLVRQYFPDHKPDVDLIAGNGTLYGTRECVHCGQRVQYEARWDRWVIFPSGIHCNGEQSTDGRRHEIERAP